MLLPRLAIEAEGVGQLDLASALCAEAIAIQRGLGFRKAEARVLATLGSIEWARGHSEEAVRLADRSAALSAEIGSRWWQAGSLLQDGEYALRLGHAGEGEFEHGRAEGRRLSLPKAVAAALS
jgi:hypothetical protein